ncbi:MAG: HEPN domain-containing protein [Candidatus Magasanikbacteria bacterium]
MKNNKPSNYKDWFKKADKNYKSAQLLLREGGPLVDICFFSHQIVEKYLKGALVYFKKSPPKTHDLLALGSLLEEEVNDMDRVYSELENLNQYYLETRYPGFESDFEEKETKKAFEGAEEVRRFILDKTK